MKWVPASFVLSAAVSALACGTTTPKVEDASAEAGTTGAAEAKPAEKPRIPFAERAPKVGEAAPVQTFATLSGDPLTLPSPEARGPTVLIFGSFS